MRYGLIIITSAALACSACEVAADAKPVQSADQACQLATQATVEIGQYQASQIAGCDVVASAGQTSGYYVLRLNAECREELCGSVLLGWFGVERTTGRVYVWDISENSPINEVGHPICQLDCFY